METENQFILNRAFRCKGWCFK